MVNYSSVPLIAFIWFFTVLCFSVNKVSVSASTDATDSDYLIGNISLLFDALSSVSGSSNVIVALARGLKDKDIEFIADVKKTTHFLVTQGGEMEKKIRDISNSLKNLTKLITKDLHAELEEIETTASTELKKLKSVENVDYLNDIQKQVNNYYAKIEEDIKELSSIAQTVVVKKEQKYTVEKSKLTDLKTKTVEFIKKTILNLFATNYKRTVSDKIEIADISLSKISKGFVRVKQIQYDLLKSYKEYSITDAAFLTHSSLGKCVFAIMFGILYKYF